MVNWIIGHLGDIVVLAVLGLTVVAVIVSMARSKKKGKCCGCSMAGSCQGKCH